MMPNLDPRAVTGTNTRRGVVAVICRKEQLLVIRRSVHVAAPLTWCFPGGAIEPGESEPEALIRELDEELSLAVRPARRLWQNLTPWDVHLAWWKATIDPGAIPRPHPQEVAEVCWLRPEEMLARRELLASNRQFLQAVNAGQVSLD